MILDKMNRSNYFLNLIRPILDFSCFHTGRDLFVFSKKCHLHVFESQPRDPQNVATDISHPEILPLAAFEAFCSRTFAPPQAFHQLESNILKDMHILNCDELRIGIIIGMTVCMFVSALACVFVSLVVLRLPSKLFVELTSAVA